VGDSFEVRIRIWSEISGSSLHRVLIMIFWIGLDESILRTSLSEEIGSDRWDFIKETKKLIRLWEKCSILKRYEKE
jgi:hypothetical protein